MILFSNALVTAILCVLFDNRQVGVTIDNTVGKTGGRRDYARAVNKGALVGACEDRNMDCPALHPAFTKMNDLLNYFGMRRQ